MRTACPGLWIDSFQAHNPHQPLDSFSVHFVAQSPRGFQILLIDEPHQLKILRFHWFLLVVEGGSADIQQPALAGVNGLKKTHIFGEKRTSSPFVCVESKLC